jgi:hypothetical protein
MSAPTFAKSFSIASLLMRRLLVANDNGSS